MGELHTLLNVECLLMRSHTLYTSAKVLPYREVFHCPLENLALSKITLRACINIMPNDYTCGGILIAVYFYNKSTEHLTQVI